MPPGFLACLPVPVSDSALWSPSPEPRALTGVWALGADQAEAVASGLSPGANRGGPATNSSAR